MRPRYYESETPGSFALRIEGRIGMAPGTLTSIARSLSETKDVLSVLTTLTAMSEQLTGLEPGTIVDGVALMDSRSRRRGARFLCLDCAADEDVEVLPHDDYHCCLKHSRWIGPESRTRSRSDTSASRLPQRGPWSSKVVNDDVLLADQIFRSLRAQGRATLQLIRELIDTIDQSDGSETPGIPTPDNYVTLVNLLTILTDREFHREILDPTITVQTSVTLFNNRLKTAVPSASDKLVAYIWFLLDPPRVAIEELLNGLTPGSTGVIDIDIEDIVKGHTVMRPLKPFSRNGSQPSFVAWAQWRQRLLVTGQSDVPRGSVRQSAHPYEFICDHGHRYRTSTNAVSKAVQQGNSGCPYCSGRSALAGFNSMAETHPALAAQWHQELNEDITPSHITGAGNSQKYWWQCEQGHAWQETPNNRSKARACPYCSGQRVIVDETSLDVTHPAIAKEWDFAANGDLRPEVIQPGSGKKVAWICPRQHSYMATVDSRTGRGTGCPVCANLKVLKGFNDLATTHPEIASEWDHELNGEIQPEDVVAGSKTKRHWVCQLGHRYTSAAVTRVAGKGCAVCAGAKVLAGFNDLATVNATVAKEWHPTLNEELTPTAVTAGSGRKVFWVCALSHVYEQTVAKRVAGSGCPVCANKKVLPGFNDIATRYPGIASDWHPTKNAPLLATEILPGNNRRWWLCQNDHEQYGTVPNRLKTRGCSACPPHERAGADPAE